MTPGRSLHKPRSHYPLTSKGAQNRPNYFGQRDLRCPLLRPDPAQRARLVEIRDNLHTRIEEARREGWLGEVEGLQVSLNAVRQKLHQMDDIATMQRTATHLGMPAFPDAAGRTLPAAQ